MTEARERMVEKQLEARDISDPRVLDAFRRVARERFVPIAQAWQAHDDGPVPIGDGQTISQPYVVASMTQAIAAKPSMRVLEVGTGSGYQTAILAELVDQVYTIEIRPELARRALAVLAELGYDNVQARVGDGYSGWPEEAPFDAIVVTAAPLRVPPPLIAQLSAPGRLVVPVGDYWQELVLIEKDASGKTHQAVLYSVRFVPMTGQARGGSGGR